MALNKEALRVFSGQAGIRDAWLSKWARFRCETNQEQSN